MVTTTGGVSNVGPSGNYLSNVAPAGSLKTALNRSGVNTKSYGRPDMANTNAPTAQLRDANLQGQANS